MKSRNPFRVRTAEHFVEDDGFLRLFGPTALDFFDPDDMWGRTKIIRGARGGGKTSILKIFSPRSLLTAAALSEDPKVAPIFERLCRLGALGGDGSVKVMGVMLSMFSNYPAIEQIGLDRRMQDALFFSMVASKIAIAALRSACELKELEFPAGLGGIRVGRPGDPNVPAAIPAPCSGKDLYEWASETERRAHDAIEGGAVGGEGYAGIAGHETLAILRVVQSTNMRHGGAPVAPRTLVMLDDVDKLTGPQRASLSQALADLRVPGVWMAERPEALRADELLAPNGTRGREYARPATLERFWRRNPSKFKSLLREISDKRAAPPGKYDGNALSANLDDSLGQDPKGVWEDILHEQRSRVAERFGRLSKYRELIGGMDDGPDPIAGAAKWKSLELAITRENKTGQARLNEDTPLDRGQFMAAMPPLGAVSRYLVAAKYKMPYCYGFDDLCALSSSNVRQFLELASGLFDDMMAAKMLDADRRITAVRQDRILRSAADERWEEIVQTIDCPGLERFLDNMAEFCAAQTLLPGAPYLGVTGIAISARDQRVLQRQSTKGTNPRYAALANVLSTCFGHNILEPNPDFKQGRRGSKHLVVYMNRLLCLRYGLPLQYGGWREKTLEALCGFMERGRRTAGKEGVPHPLEAAA